MFAGQDNEESSVCAARAQIKASNDHAVSDSLFQVAAKSLRCSYLEVLDLPEAAWAAGEETGQAAYLGAS